jgi:hypothetical protein
MSIVIDKMTGRPMIIKSPATSMTNIENTSAMEGANLAQVLDNLKNNGQDLTFVEGKGPILRYNDASYRVTLTEAGVLGIEGPLA